MKSFKEIVLLTAEELESMLQNGECDDRIFGALTLKNFIEKYHLSDEIESAINQFKKFKTVQCKQISLTQQETDSIIKSIENLLTNENFKKEPDNA